MTVIVCAAPPPPDERQRDAAVVLAGVVLERTRPAARSACVNVSVSEPFRITTPCDVLVTV